MTDKKFEIFLENTIKNFGEDYISFSEETLIEHKFSKSFERKMERLIRRQRRFYRPEVKMSFKRTVSAVFTAMIVLSVLAIGVSAIVSHFMTKRFETHTNVQAVQDDTAPENFKDIYNIAKIPEGFEIVYQNDNYENAPWLTTEYRNNQSYIAFTQYIKSAYSPNLNTEGYEMIPAEINGCEGFVIDWGDGSYIAWDNGDYVFELIGNININEMKKIADSVQKAE